jgi:hypothetical protein
VSVPIGAETSAGQGWSAQALAPVSVSAWSDTEARSGLSASEFGAGPRIAMDGNSGTDTNYTGRSINFTTVQQHKKRMLWLIYYSDFTKL